MKKVLLGMSGGVDSSVSAILLQKQGYEVIGATMILWEEIESNGEIDANKEEKNNSIEDAKRVCEKLGIKHYVLDLRKEFKEKVVNKFICTYMCAKTPNPCVECNKFMKFDAFYKFAKELGCEYIATGHYAKCFYSEKFKQYVLAKADASEKDQSYFLYGIDKEILPHIIFPLSEFKDKAEIRSIAEEAGLEVANKKDSQEVCFIPDNDYINFLRNHKDNIEKTSDSKAKKINLNKQGNIILSNGEILGTHTGLINYTVGQRRGLGIAYKEPLYVIKLDKEKNEVIVGTEKELYSNELWANELNFLVDVNSLKTENKEQNNMQEEKHNEEQQTNQLPKIEIEAKIRYRSKPAKATLKIENNIAKVKFLESQRAITPGQSVVFYLNNIVLGGGKIL